MTFSRFCNKKEKKYLIFVFCTNNNAKWQKNDPRFIFMFAPSVNKLFTYLLTDLLTDLSQSNDLLTYLLTY